MSFEFLPTLEKEVVSKKTPAIASKGEAKKEGASLFDSLMQDIAKQKPDTDTSKAQGDKSKSKKDGNILNAQKMVSKDGTILKGQTPAKKMVDQLVEIVVDGSKKELKTQKKVIDTKKIKTKTTTHQPKVDSINIDANKIKQKVYEKVQAIKESTKELAHIINPKQKPTIKETKDTQDILEKVQAKVKTIKKSTATIKNEVQTLVVKDTLEELPKELHNQLVETATKEPTSKKKTLLTLQNEIKKDIQKNNKTVQTLEDKVEVIEHTTDEITQKVKEFSKKADQSLKTIDEDKQLSQSLDDKVVLIEKNADKIENEITKVVITTEELVAKIQEFKKQSSSNTIIKTTTQLKDHTKSTPLGNETTKESLLSTGFLMEQKQHKQKVSLQHLDEAKKNIQEHKTVEAVKKSAQILELNPQKMNIEQVGESGESKSELFAKHEKAVQEQFYQSKALNKIVIERDQNREFIHEQTQQKIAQTQNIQKEQEEAEKKVLKNININVAQPVVETIQSKIVGAHQRMGSFMSEIARNMYLNYKPPFTAFRLSLNPANLGTISIIMRASNKDSSLNVSMNMSHGATLDSFVDNKTALHNALQKQLGENTNITLDFGMDTGTNSENFNENMGQSDQDKSSFRALNQEIESTYPKEQEEATSLDYM